MTRALVFAIAFGLLAACGSGAARRPGRDAGAQQGTALPSGSTIRLAVGEDFLLYAPNVARVTIGDSSVADVVPVGAATLSIRGVGPGTTALAVTYSNGREDDYTVEVH